MSRNKTLTEALLEGRKRLAHKENGGWDAMQLLLAAAGCSRVYLMTEGNTEMTEEAAQKYAAFLNEREGGRPLQYILGECEFMGLPFFVGEGVLIPRADTEILVETVLERAEREGLKTGLDLGTGSGCIPISLEKVGGLTMTAVDISPRALDYAQRNAARNEAGVRFLFGDLFHPLTEGETFDFIVSNPPYIPHGDLAALMEEVRDHEPENALDGGSDGLDFYRRILAESGPYLREGGWMFFEMGYDQGPALMELMKEAGFVCVECRKDLAGLDRVVLGKRKEV
ncbi:peptide chain release factor N(5)-glutamine methyltransferase [Anaerotignum lactatifermentans]|uniref:Release factor glutamine methyltransferase n=1 Tax=Anaerotignum lactatifermentans TaxID=160404 RepID=A0ABS2GC78_9FIRM|nr:peptide chain release factor N(5)-glutamine methyltransferase [Anaerotignum lactatifermentans]MBM6830216.1 peptide chain release factor N(5)-glutamine methyltransferase [Anaerotignum lactatifermentans]MBM6878765.1 peptide chain release factor N(5)-glutamine methyltransferase [Anaerotignum lactatifermentans]MBM6951829.1 peptide chain release factor N(5)-glutamine methyltransferase [Anaerotignum lactatifermentans]